MTRERNDFGNRLDDIRMTPPELVQEVSWLVGKTFTLDVAASPGIERCGDYYALERGQDGLSLPWHGDVWCNPNYSEIGRWVDKAWAEHDAGRTDSITTLIPANRTDQAWWHTSVEGQESVKVRFLRGRRKFLMPDGSPIYAKKKSGEFILNAKGEKVVGSPSFGLCVLHWSTP